MTVRLIVVSPPSYKQIELQVSPFQKGNFRAALRSRVPLRILGIFFKGTRLPQ